MQAVLCMQLQYRLSATGVRGSLEITRVDWDHYKLKYKFRGDRRSTSRLFKVAGVQNEFKVFLNLVREWKGGTTPDAPKSQSSPAAPATPSIPVRRNRFEETQGAQGAAIGPNKSEVPAPDAAGKAGKDSAEKGLEWRGRPEEGFKDLALAAAIMESGETGLTIQVPTL
jgi:hypothetical protein